MNKTKCENKMKELNVWNDLNIGDDGYQICIYPTKDMHWFPTIGVHSTFLDTMGEFEFTPKMKTVWESVWSLLQDDLQSEYCGCNDCLEGAK